MINEFDLDSEDLVIGIIEDTEGSPLNQSSGLVLSVGET